MLQHCASLQHLVGLHQQVRQWSREHARLHWDGVKLETRGTGLRRVLHSDAHIRMQNHATETGSKRFHFSTVCRGKEGAKVAQQEYPMLGNSASGPKICLPGFGQ
jgi:hypothetical protein